MTHQHFGKSLKRQHVSFQCHIIFLTNKIVPCEILKSTKIVFQDTEIKNLHQYVMQQNPLKKTSTGRLNNNYTYTKMGPSTIRRF